MPNDNNINNAVPISGYVIKIASRCNLNCSYCYEYNMGDSSWKKMSKYMPEDVFLKTLIRIKEHCETHLFDNVSISLHGGEPLLVGHSRLKNYLKLAKEVLDGFRLTMGIQTNGILIDDEYIEVFENNGVSVGVSLDGLPKNNDLFRFYHNGKGSGKDVERKLELLKSSGMFGGILSVINIDSDPIQTWRHLASFNPPVIDFLLPHAHWENTKTEEQFNKIAKHGDWLCTIFDDWYGGYRQDIRIRFFEEIIYRLFGHPGSLESLGLEEVSLITVGVNGDYEQVDTMKSVFPGAHTISLNVNQNSLDEVLKHQNVVARQSGISGVSDHCQKCSIVSICGGGYYPHRYSEKNIFNNPSVYCTALMKLIIHIQTRIKNDLEFKKNAQIER
jgi:uncharacterized protein